MMTSSSAVDALSKALDQAVADGDNLMQAYGELLRELFLLTDERDALEERVRELCDRLWERK